MELTFNLNKLMEQNIRVPDFNILRELAEDPNRKEWELFFKPYELERVLQTSISFTSRDLREFLDDIFGIDMGIDNSSNRNRLNEIIKNHVPTKRGQRTKLNYYHFRNLILSDEFNRFILRNHQEDKSIDPRRMYEEIMFLQNNKFKESALYLEQKKNDIIYYANALSLLDGFDQIIKNFYWAFIDLRNNGVYYGDINAPKEYIQMLDIVSYRFRQKSKLVYKFDSKEDVFTTNSYQIIEFFLQDVNRWANEEIK